MNPAFSLEEHCTLLIAGTYAGQMKLCMSWEIPVGLEPITGNLPGQLPGTCSSFAEDAKVVGAMDCEEAWSTAPAGYRADGKSGGALTDGI